MSAFAQFSIEKNVFGTIMENMQQGRSGGATGPAAQERNKTTMKMKKTAAFAAAALLCMSLFGCTIKSPATVGSIGGVEIPAGVYLLAQYNAYEQAATRVEDSKKVLTSKIKDSEQTGAEYIAEETLKFIELYAAVETRFAELGGELTEEQQATVESQTETLWTQSQKSYEKNGIGRTSLKSHVANIVKQDALLDMIYGNGGGAAVADDELAKWVEQNYLRADYLTLPIIDFTNYVMLTEDQTAKMRTLADEAAAEVNGGKSLEEIAEDTLKKASEISGSEYSANLLASSLGNTIFSPSQMSYYGEEAAAAMKGAKPGEATVVNIGSSLLVLVRQETVLTADYTIDSIRSSALSAMKSSELEEELRAQGAAAEHQLDQGAMNTYSAKKVKA